MPVKYIILTIGGTVILFTLTIFVIAFIFISKRKHFSYLKEKEFLANKFSQTLLQTQLEIKEQILAQVSQEVHDNLGQIASLIKINLLTLELDNSAKASVKIKEATDLTRRLIADLKSLSVSLSSDGIARTGLVAAIEAEAARLNNTGQFMASFRQEGEMPEMDNGKAIILYRMVQEVLNNMIKHSGAKHINILLTKAENLFILALSDDGAGFNMQEKMNSGGAGLLNLQNRAKLIHAELSINSSSGNGTQVTIKLPL